MAIFSNIYTRYLLNESENKSLIPFTKEEYNFIARKLKEIINKYNNEQKIKEDITKIVKSKYEKNPNNWNKNENKFIPFICNAKNPHDDKNVNWDIFIISNCSKEYCNAIEDYINDILNNWDNSICEYCVEKDIDYWIAMNGGGPSKNDCNDIRCLYIISKKKKI